MIKKFLFSSLIVLCAFSTFAQRTSKKPAPKPQAPKQASRLEDPDNLASQYFSQIMGVAVNATSNLKLYKFIYEWIGTPYHFGGNTKKGIDCSAFAKTIYDKVFNTTILRNSRDIFSTTSPLTKDELKEGDLVFFRSDGKRISHVGVYLGDDRFVHASSSRGVKIDNLNEPYYARIFYKGGRIIEPDEKDFIEE